MSHRFRVPAAVAVLAAWTALVPASLNQVSAAAPPSGTPPRNTSSCSSATACGRTCSRGTWERA
jgi:hypothetical protein